MVSVYLSTIFCCARELENAYQEKKGAGGYEALRPRSTREEVALMNQRLDDAWSNGRPQLGIQYCPTRIQAAAAVPVSFEEELAENSRQLNHLLVLAEAAEAQEQQVPG
jgi:hypothetical protein